MAQTYSPQVIAAAIAEIRRTERRRIEYRAGQWFVYTLQGTSTTSAPVPAVPADAQRWDQVLVTTEARLNPPPPPPTNWWQRVAWGNNGPAPSGGGSGAGGGGAPGGASPAWLNNIARGSIAAAAGYNVHQSGQSGERAATAVVRGAASIVKGAFQAGADIGNALIRGAMKPFGASGAAVAQFAEQLTQVLGRGISAVLDGATKIAGAGGKAVGLGVGLATAGAGALVGGALGLAGAGVGAIPGALIGSIVGVALMKVTQAVGEMVGGVLSAVGSALGAVGEVVSSVLRAVTDVVGDLTESALKLSRAALDLSQKSGLSIGAASNANNLLAGFGIKPGGVDGLNRNVFVQSAISRAFGVQGEQGSAGYLDSFRSQYQKASRQGPLGLLRAQMGAQSMGLESLIPMANLSDKVFNRQVERSQSMQSSFGMTPEKMQDAAQNFGTLTATVSQFADLAKAKIGSELLPYIILQLDNGISWITAHSGQIVDGIKNGVSWMINDLPSILQNAAVAGLTSLQALSNGAANFIDTIAAAASSMKDGNAFTNLIGNILEGIDWISVGFSGFMSALGAFGLVVYDIGAMVINTLGGAFNFIKGALMTLGTPALNAMGLGSVARSINAFQIPTAQLIDPRDAYQKQIFPTTDFRGSFEASLQDIDWDKGANALHSGANSIRDFSDNQIGGAIDTVKNLSFGKSGESGQMTEGENQVALLLRGILRAVEGTEDNTQSMAQRNYAKEAEQYVLQGRRLARARG